MTEIQTEEGLWKEIEMQAIDYKEIEDNLQPRTTGNSIPVKSSPYVPYSSANLLLGSERQTIPKPYQGPICIFNTFSISIAKMIINSQQQQFQFNQAYRFVAPQAQMFQNH